MEGGWSRELTASPSARSDPRAGHRYHRSVRDVPGFPLRELCVGFAVVGLPFDAIGVSWPTVGPALHRSDATLGVVLAITAVAYAAAGLVVALGVATFYFYVAVEGTSGQWSATLPKHRGFAGTAPVLWAGSFSAGLFAGRLVAARFGTRVGPERLLEISAGVLTGGLLLCGGRRGAGSAPPHCRSTGRRWPPSFRAASPSPLSARARDQRRS